MHKRIFNMAKVYLESTDTAFTISNSNTSVFGASGTQEVTIASGVTGVKYDANTERVIFSGASSAYTYAQSGNLILVYSGTTLVAMIPVQTGTEDLGADGTRLTFTDGTANATFASGVISVGGKTVTGTATANYTTGTATNALPAAVTSPTLDTTVTTPSTGTGTVTGQAYTLTSSSTADTFALTTANDTVTGASGTLAASDAIIDVTATDSDTMTAQVTSATLAPTITKVETVTINGDFVTTGLDLANVRGTKTLTFNTGIVSGSATVGTTTAGAGAQTASVETVKFGSNVTTATINTDATVGTNGTLKVDAGSVTSLTFVGGSAVDNVSLTTNGNLTLTANPVETLTLTPTVASKAVTLGDASTTATIDVAGSVASTIKGTATNLTGRTITKSGTGALTVEVITTGGTTDLSKVAADGVTLSINSGAAITVKNGTTITTSVDQGASTTIGSIASTASTNTVTLNNSASTQTAITGSNIKTLTINSSATAVTGVDATYTLLDVSTSNNVVLGGTNDVKVTGGKAKSVDASGLVGFLNYTQTADDAASVTVKGGSGSNVITFKNTTQDVTYVGKDGGDSVTLATIGANASITTGAGLDNITANTVTTGTISATTGAGNDTLNATSLTSGILSASLGDGDDVVTLGTGITGAVVMVVDGGSGTDTLRADTGSVFKSGTLNLTSVEVIEIVSNGNIEFSAAQMTGQTFTVNGTSTTSNDILKVTGVGSTTTIDLSGLTMNETTAKGMESTTINATASAAAVTIKGTAIVDTITVSANGSTITAGGGADAITGAGGIDKIVYAAATSAALLSEAGATASGVSTTAPTAGGDTIGTFTAGTDKIVLSTTFGTAGASGGLVASSGASYTTSSTTLLAADFLTGVGGPTLTSDATNGGRFYFNTTTSKLYYDALGDSVGTLASPTSGFADDFLVATVTGVTITATDFMFV